MQQPEYYRIIDATTGKSVPTMYTYYARSERGAIRMFRQRFALAHNYPNVVALPALQRLNKMAAIGETVTFGANSNFPGAQAIVTGYLKYDDGSLGYMGRYTANAIDPTTVGMSISFDESLLVA